MGSIRQNNYSSYTYLFSLCSITDFAGLQLSLASVRRIGSI